MSRLLSSRGGVLLGAGVGFDGRGFGDPIISVPKLTLTMDGRTGGTTQTIWVQISS